MSNEEYDSLLADWQELEAENDRLARQLAEAEALSKSRRILLEASTEALNSTMADLDEAEQRCQRWERATLAGAAFIGILDQGKGPSDVAYLPLRDCWRNAVDDLPTTEREVTS